MRINTIDLILIFILSLYSNPIDLKIGMWNPAYL